jgi:polysaccharide export outer membrane protein
MNLRPFMTKFAVQLSCLLGIGLALSARPLCAAEGNSGTGNISPQQVEQILQNATPQQLQQILQNATPQQIQQILQNPPSKQTISPYETIYVEEPPKGVEKPSKDETPSKDEKIKTPGKKDQALEESMEENVSDIPRQDMATEEMKVFSATEQLYQQRYGSTLAESLEQYGYTLFESPTKTSSKLAVPSDDYLIGPGDKLRIRIWGKDIDGAYTVTVSREGTIDIPQIGILPITGSPLGKLEDIIRSEAEKYVEGIHISVSLAELRSIEVYVVGEVDRPGLHLVPPFSTVIGGLIAGEGVKKTGSLRTISLFRGGKLFKIADLYSLLLHGSRDGDVNLQDGDVIFVPRLGPTAAIAGATSQPAIYELTTEKSVADLLELAGGALPQSSTDRIYLRRFDNNQHFVVLDIDKQTSKSDLATIAIKNGDLLELQYLETLWPKVVRLEGNVWFPDVFTYRPFMKLSDVLTDVSLLKPNSITDFGLVYRYDPQTTRYKVERFPLSDVLNGQYDADLYPYDKIEILSRDDYGIKEPVKIVGSVWRPDDYVFTPGLTLGDLLGLAGGFKFDADPQRIDLSRQIIKDGEVTTAHFALHADTDASFALQPYDYIYIRKVRDAASFKSVSITGEVKFPGDYRIKDGEHLSDLIERAGGFTDKAYFYGAYFISLKAQEIQQKSINRMVDDLEIRVQNVLAEQAQIMAASEDEKLISGQQAALQNLVSRLRQVKATGRMSITLGPVASMKGTALDFELQEGDSLHIPQRPNFVSVVGSVYSPNSFMYEKTMKLGDYLQKAGGPSKTADKNAIYLIKANGEILASATAKGMFSNFYDLALMPGDTIVVPEDLYRIPAMAMIRDIADIVFKIATTAGIIWAI